jgi:hypothetical protein
LDLRLSKFTQVINEVTVMEPQTKAVRAAQLKTDFVSPEILRTGPGSRAELTAMDQTLTRVGANTVFSFEPTGRNVDLQQGCLLFHSPKGKGGGTVKSAGASATVLGTTLIVSATANGGFKVIVLEGKAQVKLPGGARRNLVAGQLLFILPNAERFGPLLSINLGHLVKSSKLVQGFKADLPSLGKISEAVREQEHLVEVGEAEDTGQLVGNYATEEQVQVVDSNVLEKRIESTPDEWTFNHQALSIDGTIGTALLDRNLYRSHLVLEPFQYLAAMPESPPNALGFLGRTLTINTPQIDLSEWTASGYADFVFLAAGALNIEGNLTLFSAVPPTDPNFTLHLAGKGGLSMPPGSALNVIDCGYLALSSGVDTAFNNTSFSNSRDIVFRVDGALSLDGSVITSGNVVSLFGQGIRLDSCTINSPAILYLDAAYDLGGSIEAFDVQLNGTRQAEFEAAQNIALNTVYLTSPMDSLSLKTADTIDLTKVWYSAGNSLLDVASVNLEAHTIILNDIHFPAGSRVNLQCQTGQLAPNPNTGQPVLNGHVNYLLNVTHGGIPAQISTTQVSTPAATGTGIFISPQP